MNFLKLIKSKLEKGHDRSIRARKNVLLALFYKGLGVLIGFAYVPMSLAYIGQTNFGIYLTVASISNWFVDMNIGVGSGLQNKFAVAVADGDTDSARKYISTGYFILSTIITGFMIVFLGVNFIIPWASWLNVEVEMNYEIAMLALFVFTAFSFRFITTLFFSMLFALQKTAISTLLVTVMKLIFLVALAVLMYTTDPSLLKYGFTRAYIFALVPLLFSLYFFRNDFKAYRPSIKLIRRSYIKPIISLGIKFFAIRISLVILHETNHLLIANLVSVGDVASYEIAFKLMALFIVLFDIVNRQFWGANIEAYRKKEFGWMKNSMKGVLKTWIGSLVIMIFVIFASPYLYEIWLRGRIDIPMELTVSVALFVASTTFINIFNTILNGASKIQMQMYCWIFSGVTNIPFSIILVKYFDLGVIGIVYGTIISMLPLMILSPLQVYKILHQKDTGLWAK